MRRICRKDRAEARRWRASGAVLLALFVLGQVWGTLHFSVVAHEVCPVDGALAHGEHEHGAGELGHAPAETDEAVVDLEEQGDPHEEHCSVLASREQRKLIVLPRVASVEPLVEAEHCSKPRDEGSVARIPVLSYAPKQSPPHAA